MPRTFQAEMSALTGVAKTFSLIAMNNKENIHNFISDAEVISRHIPLGIWSSSYRTQQRRVHSLELRYEQILFLLAPGRQVNLRGHTLTRLA